MLCRLREHHGLCLVLQFFLSVLAGHVVWTYLRMPLHGCFSFILGLGIFYLFKNRLHVPCFLRVFSIFLSISFILAYHVVLSGGFHAPATQNYITPYSFFDLIAFGVLEQVIEQTLAQGLQKLSGVSARVIKEVQQEQQIAAPASICNQLMQYPLWVYVGIMVLCWSPWLLTWYPGFIFWDSIDSVLQALEKSPINNHHPVLYTMWIKLWLAIGMKLHSVNVGCLLYTVSQMILMAFSLSYSARWMYRHGMHPAFCLLTIAWFALTPFFAQNNITMWKDPLFSAIVLFLVLNLYDIFLCKTVLQRRKIFLFIFIFALLCFVRNNGAWLLLFTSIGIAILAFFQSGYLEKRVYVSLASAALIISAVSIVIQGPVFAKLRWTQSFAETVGIPLNQMSRIICYNGATNEENRALMNNLFPLEKYQKAYAPCTFDKIKWFKDNDGSRFNADYLGKHKDEFFRNYFSMIVKNPRLAFESWQLQTVGYWSPTHYTFLDTNIPMGNLKSLKILEKRGHGIWQRNLLENRFIDTRLLFSELDASFSLGTIFWLILLTAAIALKKRHWPTLAALLPALALDATLLLASPVFWPRYGYAVILLLPVMLFLLLQLLQDKCEARAA